MKRLVLYSYSKFSKSQAIKNRNVDFFIKKGIIIDDSIYYYFIVNGKEIDNDLKSLVENKMLEVNNIYSNHFNIIFRENIGHDFGAYADIIFNYVKYIDYDSFFFINDSVRGPFISFWSKNKNWIEIFESLLDNNTKLIGPTLNFYSGTPHINSEFFMTDKIGIQVLIDTGIFSMNFLTNFQQVCIEKEVKMSTVMLNANYNIRTLLEVYKNIDFRVCRGEKYKNSVLNANTKWGGDSLYTGGYYNGNINLYEVIFIKANRNIDDNLIDRYTNWSNDDYLKELNKIYTNKTRKGINASQSENVKIEYHKKRATIRSYQTFNIGNGILEPLDNTLIAKEKIMDSILRKLSIYNSIADIGASNGYFTYLAKRNGFKECTIVEHDSEFTDVINEINSKYNIDIKTLNQKFGEMNNLVKYDVIMMLALIHWIYSCTEINGSFDKIMGKISNITDHVLIIEWIDKTDGAIKNFNHIDFNKDTITEDYNEDNFKKSLLKYFSSYYILPTYEDITRKIYVAYKDFTDSIESDNFIIEQEFANEKFYRMIPHNELDKGTSEMYITSNKKYILKKCIHYLEYYPYEREVYWYNKLTQEQFVPKLVYKNDQKKILITEYFGDRINIHNIPKDWDFQLKFILDTLNNKYQWSNLDLKPTEILVSSNGKLGIIDFGWCKYNGSYLCENNWYCDPKIIRKASDIFEEIRKIFFGC